MRLSIVFTIVLTLFFQNCNTDSESISQNNLSSPSSHAFSEAKNSGVSFVNSIQETSDLNHFIWDSMYNGGGVGVGDINNDGLQDIYFSANYGPDQLYLNKGNLQFEDISKTAGIGMSKSISSGVNMVDVNKDGLIDIYVCKYGFTEDPTQRINELYINNGDMTFTESAAAYGIANTGYSLQSSFFDFDKDGFLDLYVMNQPSNARTVKGRIVDAKFKDSELINDDTSDCLYRNNGNNTFTNISASAGIRNYAFGLGVVAADIDGDGWTDIFVANDYDRPDLLYINQKNGTFKDVAKTNFDHISNFSMGTDIADINHDQLPDIGVLDMAGANHYRSKTNMPSMSTTAFWKLVNAGYHFQYMHNTLHLNQGGGNFTDQAYLSGIAKTDWSWSLLINDFNNDSNEDIYITNGIKKDVRNNDYIQKTKELITAKGGNITDVMEIVNMVPSTPMSNYMYINDGHSHFDDQAEKLGLGVPGYSNGAAYADLDNDGDLDLIVNNVNAPASIFANNASTIGNSLRISLTTSSSNKSTLNSKATVYADGKKMTKELINARGFMSTSEPILHFGLGEISKVDSVIITWPDNNESIHTDLKVNALNIVDQSKTKKIRKYSPQRDQAKYFASQPDLNSLFKHNENTFNAFSSQLLLPYEPSELGPFLAKADLNGDGLEDIVVGGATGQSTTVLLQNGSGGFTSSSLDGSAKYEDMGITTFDADGDGDQDIYVCSGGYQAAEGSSELQDRLYINDGKGRFAQGKLPELKSNTSTSIAYDYDKDGDIDILVFGRVISGVYPNAPRSYLLENGGKGDFQDVTITKASFLESFGMVTDATLANIGGQVVVVTVGEWMSPNIISVESGQLVANQMGDDLGGLWFSIAGDDLDGDGDTDFVLGNLGKNSKFKASAEKPFRVYASDFDHNGKSDIVLASYYGDKVVPVRGKECSSEQVPELLTKFKSYEAFATADIGDIYDLKEANKLEAQTLQSGILWNDAGTWRFEPLAIEAQVSPINAIVIDDVNKDGSKDIIVAGNLYAMEVETTRLDAGKGLLLLGKNGKFEPVSPSESGLFAKGDAKDMVEITVGNTKMIAISMNDANMQFFKLK